MLQMYKVFFNEQIIYIDSSKESEPDVKWQKISDLNKVSGLLVQFMQGDDDLFLLTDKGDEILEIIKSELFYLETAGGIVENEDEELLFIYRLGYWDLPKGMIEKGETAKQAAYREIKEECGISSHKLKSHLTDTYHIYEREGKMHLKKTIWFYFEQGDTNEETVPQAEEDIELASWLSETEINLALLESYESIEDVYDAYKSM